MTPKMAKKMSKYDKWHVKKFGCTVEKYVLKHMRPKKQLDELMKLLHGVPEERRMTVINKFNGGTDIPKE